MGLASNIKYIGNGGSDRFYLFFSIVYAIIYLFFKLRRGIHTAKYMAITNQSQKVSKVNN